MEFSLAGKVALVTGGSRGIGRVTALGFARAGADIVATSRNLPDLEKVAQEVRILGRRSLAIAAHVGRMDDIKALVTKVNEEFGGIDILVNNAGTSPALASVLEAEERLWDVIINLNLKGLFFLSQAVARVMKEHGGGKIINVASMDGFKPELNNSIYAISKAGVIMATKAMALELAQFNIRVNAIAPGNVHTRLGDSRFSEGGYGSGYEEHMIKRTPLGRIAEPDEMVGAMIYLASDASGFVTGQTLCLDGGLLLT
jgi:NAD(P)-dependent dehydrogenase (short-subunit alcohol dehydrogenase family)